MLNPSAATAPESRIPSIDVLRGVALMGILVMNIQSFSMPMAAYMNPHAYGDLSGIHYAIWLVGRLLFDGKFIAIFSMLFGAGVAMAAERKGNAPGAGRIYARRYVFLLVLGLLHAYLLWYGDVLTYYAVCAFVLYPLRRAPVRKLLLLALVAYGAASAVLAAGAWAARGWPSAQAEATRVIFAPQPHELLGELETMRGGFWGILADRFPLVLELHFFVFPIFLLPTLLGFMLLGMALYRSGVIQAQWSGARYALLIAIALGIGVPIVHAGNLYLDATGWAPAAIKFTGAQPNHWAAPVVALGWIGAVMLWCQNGGAPGIRHAVACLGRMALTNYIAQTLICVFVFYGFGLGWFGHVERAGQLLFVVCVWGLQLAWSPIWLRHFRYGPLEWLWRSFTYGRIQPMRRKEASS